MHDKTVLKLDRTTRRSRPEVEKRYLTLMLIFGLFAAFGAFCGLWLSIVGFAITIVGLGVVCGTAGLLFGGSFTGLSIVYAIMALQLGYFASIAAMSLGKQILRSPSDSAHKGDEKSTTKISEKPN